MLVSEILTTVRPAYCGTWDKVFEYFKTTPHEWRRVQELMEEIRTVGQLEPGRIEFRSRDEDEPEDEEEYYYLGNGTHRFAAVVELGHDDFFVTDEVEEPVGESYDGTEVELWIKKEFLTISEDFEDPIEDCLLSSLSFRVNERVWAECGGLSSTGLHHARSYELSFVTLPHEELEEFTRAFLARIACCVKPEMIDYLSVGNVTHYDEKFWTN